MKEEDNNKEKTAIILAMFGVSFLEGLPGLLGIWEKTKESFPNTRIAISFTSNIIRRIWQKRLKDPSWNKTHQVPTEILNVKGLLGTIGDLQNQGFSAIVVQPTYLCHGEQYEDLLSYIRAINSIETVKDKWMPFKKPISVGRPLTGTWGPKYPYRNDLDRLVNALKEHIETARKLNASIVYMGHGNRYMANGIYTELEYLLNKAYPDVGIFIGTVEGFPSIDYIIKHIKTNNKRQLLLYPLMIVAGQHAIEDMAGDSKDSWKNKLSRIGYEVKPIFKGLGELETIQDIFISHIKDAAKEINIIL